MDIVNDLIKPTLTPKVTHATHTPGPWTTSPNTTYVRAGGVHGYNICGIWDGMGNEEADANARLIATAPEMLEALQNLAQMAREYVAEGIPLLDAAIEKAAMVALKARGDLL